MPIPKYTKVLSCPNCYETFMLFNGKLPEDFEAKPVCPKCKVEAIEVEMTNKPDPRHLC